MSPNAAQRLDELSAGYQNAIILLTANHLGVFPALAGPPREAADAARELGLDPRALEIVLLALAAEGIVLAEAGRYRLAPEFAPLLLPGGEQARTSILEHNYNILPRWVALREVLRTGRPAAAAARERTPAELRAFICGMADISRASSEEVAGKLDLSRCARLLDVGGGPGTAIITFARRFPNLGGDVFDLPEVVAIAREEIAAAGLADRVGTVAGDFLADELGAGYDAAYVANIIHSHGPDETAALFAKCRRALAPGGLIVVKDFFLDDTRTRPAIAARFAVNMLVGTEAGKSYTTAETRALLAAAGFGECRVEEVARASALLIARRRD